MVVRNTSDLVTLTGINPIHVVTKLGEDRIKYVHLGQDAEVSFYAFPEKTFKGKVVIVNPSVDLQTRLVSVIVLVDNPDLKLMPGMSGITTLNAQHDNVRVPAVAVMAAGDGNAYVFVADADDVAHIRPVKTGAGSAGFVEILAGVSAGERVVVVGQAALHDKQKVRVGTEYDRSNH
jgi:RND family efflux transporter MFP subunit